MLLFIVNASARDMRRKKRLRLGSIMTRTALLLALTICFLAGVAAAQEDRWAGLYTFDEESTEPSGERTSNWFHLDVQEIDGKLVGFFSEGINGQAVRRFQLSIKPMGMEAGFYYDHSLRRVETTGETNVDTEFKSGELLFVLEEQPRHCKTEIVTIWRKINLASRTETGDIRDGLVFFRKVGE
ncbi:MAG: hypothetical protein ACRD43_06340 [Pyrinomonadaceae bacterium]